MAGPLYFAIGDIHGEARKLRDLHAAILDRIARENRAAKIVHLGDYVDRGPDSRGVIDQVMALEKKFDRDPVVEVVSLMGNHEEMMLAAYDGPLEDGGTWWTQGGSETCDSYAAPARATKAWRETIPKAHIDWLRKRPVILQAPKQHLVFVHAGIEPASFPNESDHTYMWTRSDRFFKTETWPDRKELKDLLVIHGHTPKTYEPEVDDRRINIDTGACFGGPLTAVVLKEGEAPEFLRAT
ncbi:MAG TPA: metallophosphoesterase family protein [Hyphomonadaceae bacterium]|nr:metallophosphoesterase family protein [Hyphomonadaceae bacterium]